MIIMMMMMLMTMVIMMMMMMMMMTMTMMRPLAVLFYQFHEFSGKGKNSFFVFCDDYSD